jgi:hypothetical protein
MIRQLTTTALIDAYQNKPFLHDSQKTPAKRRTNVTAFKQGVRTSAGIWSYFGCVLIFRLFYLLSIFDNSINVDKAVQQIHKSAENQQQVCNIRQVVQQNRTTNPRTASPSNGVWTAGVLLLGGPASRQL